MTIRIGLVIAALTACGPSAEGTEQLDASATHAGDAGRPPPRADAGLAEACSKMDIMFVIDNSGSMKEEQTALITSFPKFVEVLDNYEVAGGGSLDYRIAVTTTGTDAKATFKLPPIGPVNFPAIPMPQSGANGAFRTGCGMTRNWIERGDGNVTDSFSCIANVGVNGPSIEMQLYATKLALSRPEQTEFVRDDALLALVILTDEDDCSVEDNVPFTVQDDTCQPEPPEMEPLANYLEFLDTLKSGRERWAAAVIAGNASCPDAFRDGVRLREFVTRAGSNALERPICVSDLSGGLQDALDTFEAACDNLPPPIE